MSISPSDSSDDDGFFDANTRYTDVQGSESPIAQTMSEFYSAKSLSSNSLEDGQFVTPETRRDAASPTNLLPLKASNLIAKQTTENGFTTRRDSAASSLSSLSQENVSNDLDSAESNPGEATSTSSDDDKVLKPNNLPLDQDSYPTTSKNTESMLSTEHLLNSPDDSRISSSSGSVYFEADNRASTLSESYRHGRPSHANASTTNVDLLQQCTSRFVSIFTNANVSNAIKKTEKVPSFRSRLSNSKSGEMQLPAYVKVSNVGIAAPDSLFHGKCKLLQELKGHEGPIWTLKFSPDGRFLCSAGQDKRLIIWSVGVRPGMLVQSNSEEERSGKRRETRSSSFADNVHDSIFSAGSESSDYLDEFSLSGAEESTSKRSDFENQFVEDREYASQEYVLFPQAYRIFEGHDLDIIDVAWSKSHFLLSASLDKSVCLWHMTKSERLQSFRHPDVVTSVEFHPTSDRFFISGCFDTRLRVWDIIPEGNVKAWAQAPDMITSICFTPDGQKAVGGLFNGQVYFYLVENMKYVTQMNCRNRNGKFKDGKKVTGLSVLKKDNTGNAEGVSRKRDQLVVTTNDSRIRLVNMEDYSVECKYKSTLKNEDMQIKASLSEDGKYIICGSELGIVYIWSTIPPVQTSWLGSMGTSSEYDRNACYESWEATKNDDIATTAAIFAPAATVYHTIANSPKVEALSLPELKTKYQGSFTRGIDGSDFSSRIIVTADHEGIIRIFIREV